jgi:hypothetical protein
VNIAGRVYVSGSTRLENNPSNAVANRTLADVPVSAAGTMYGDGCDPDCGAPAIAAAFTVMIGLASHIGTIIAAMIASAAAFEMRTRVVVRSV